MICSQTKVGWLALMQQRLFLVEIISQLNMQIILVLFPMLKTLEWTQVGYRIL